jgi:hypothetical protein
MKNSVGIFVVCIATKIAVVGSKGVKWRIGIKKNSNNAMAGVVSCYYTTFWIGKNLEEEK